MTAAGKDRFDYAPRVAEALASGGAVVALESTIVAHGFPPPDNLAVGRAMEAAVAETGAVAATIAVLDGRVKIGLGESELARVASDPSLRKASSRDLASLMASGGSGATTVAATAVLAARAGIRVFATGGIGGVHRGATTDVSADLPVLAREPVAVIASGAKIILDLPATLEMLETLGVPVIGWRTDRFPGFYCADVGLGLAQRCDDERALARLVSTHLDLGLGGVLIANPPPPEHALPRDRIEAWLGRALEAAAREGVAGPATTPYLLKFLHRESAGATVACNRALAIDNARLGGRLARALGG
ncbi:MAG: pseudouridine-5'-phosphate glycosidase [Alphaproteobacteria bacterium]|nr:pseudouridine-5'-phosphate glycosidase [Alphaproteobacteria bacterium]